MEVSPITSHVPKGITTQNSEFRIVDGKLERPCHVCKKYFDKKDYVITYEYIGRGNYSVRTCGTCSSGPIDTKQKLL